MAKYNRKGNESNSDSSSESLKEITADDFKDGSRVSSRSGGWGNDYTRYKYNPVQRQSYQPLYSFAWAQAVQNKPLGIEIKKDEVEEEEIEIEMMIEENVSDGEKEEGEIEEGEIELGSEKLSCVDGVVQENKTDEKDENNLESEEKDEEIDEFDKKFGLVLEELESITEEEAKSSFEEACSKLQKCYTSLKQMFSEGHGPVLDMLAQQAFLGTQTLYSAFSFGDLKNVDQNKALLLRLLIHIKNQYSMCLTPEQIKEVDVRVNCLASEAIGLGKTTGYMNVPDHSAGKPVISTEKSKADPRLSSHAGYNSSVRVSLPMQEPSTNCRTGRLNMNPLLNLHEDYDEDSLPSPTRNNTPSLPILKPILFGSQPAPVPGQVMSTAPKKVNEHNTKLHPYITDAFKAVSSYQQKYIKNSNVVFNELPSPTPSDDGNSGTDDTHSEVSSFSVVTNSGPVSTSSGHLNNNLGVSLMAPIKPIEHNIGPGTNPVQKSSAKSRDPRLRLMNPELQNVNTKKHKAVDDLMLEDQNLKRQRNVPATARDNQISVGGGGWIEENGFASHINNKVQLNNKFNGLNASNNNFYGLSGSSVPCVSSSNASVVSLPDVLKGITVNPTMLMQLLKEQQSLGAATQQNLAVPVVNGLSNATSSILDIGKNLNTKPQIPLQTTPMNVHNETTKIRMKPRDPRRILHSNVVQKSETAVSEPTKTIASPPSDTQTKNDTFIVGEQKEQVQSAALTYQPTISPVISSELTKVPNSIADKVSSSPASTVTRSSSLLIANQISTSPTEPKTVFMDAAKSWADMDHLLDGYDEKQKADIQKERARRIAEQNKMFAARKLCLVLDLDHTLLNSAKFGEIDPSHEEILRMKEEQDKKQPERQLFRFPHMGMWTKLRPGIWNFLEKASKLFEMHVYTMGNKVYATEMAKILDPQGTLFSGRVISRGDDDESTDVLKSKDLDGVLGMESAVVIIDDSVRVWPHHKLNLIAVERYMYFPCSRRQFGLTGPSLLEVDHDERPEYGTLASSLAVIEKVHKNFFSHQSLNEVDVRAILAAEQRKILAGCKIVFSRVFPVGEANPHLHPLWQTAEQFGAECTNQIDERVTHVVANSRGTDKVNWALSTGRFAVHPGWVEASALLYRRAKEDDFAI